MRFIELLSKKNKRFFKFIPKKFSEVLSNISHIAQIILASFTVWSFFKIVLPIYNNQLLSEQNARLTIEGEKLKDTLIVFKDSLFFLKNSIKTLDTNYKEELNFKITEINNLSDLLKNKKIESIKLNREIFDSKLSLFLEQYKINFFGAAELIIDKILDNKISVSSNNQDNFVYSRSMTYDLHFFAKGSMNRFALNSASLSIGQTDFANILISFLEEFRYAGWNENINLYELNDSLKKYYYIDCGNDEIWSKIKNKLNQNYTCESYKIELRNSIKSEYYKFVARVYNDFEKQFKNYVLKKQYLK